MNTLVFSHRSYRWCRDSSGQTMFPVILDEDDDRYILHGMLPGPVAGVPYRCIPNGLLGIQVLWDTEIHECEGGFMQTVRRIADLKVYIPCVEDIVRDLVVVDKQERDFTMYVHKYGRATFRGLDLGHT